MLIVTAAVSKTGDNRLKEDDPFSVLEWLTIEVVICLRPIGELMLLNPSTVVIAGPTLKKSTKKKFGALPYWPKHDCTAAPKDPGALGSAELVLEAFSTAGVTIFNSCCFPRKWFIRNSRPDDPAAAALPLIADGRSGEQLKFWGEVT